METLGLIVALAGFIDTILSIKDKIKNSPDKEKAASFITDTADLIENVIIDLRNQNYPYDKCSHMNYLLTNLHHLSKGYLDEITRDNLEKLLNEAYAVEKLMGEFYNISSETREYNFQKLQEIAGVMRGMSHFLK